MDEDENPYLLGPFYDVDPERTEIMPAGYEESHEPLSLCMGGYAVRSNEPSINETGLEISNKDVTAFIQADWDRVFGPVPPSRGFLLSYRAGAFAAGRVGEEIVLRKLLSSAQIFESRVAEYLLFSEAQERGWVVPRKGSQSDDLILILESGLQVAVESKAAFSGRSYLRRCIPKALGQLEATMLRNPKLGGAALCLIDLSAHVVVVATMTNPQSGGEIASRLLLG